MITFTYSAIRFIIIFAQTSKLCISIFFGFYSCFLSNHLYRFLKSLCENKLWLSSYSKKPGVSNFRFAKDISARNYRKQEKCDVDVVLNWKQELQSSCLSTPIIYPFFKSGSKDVWFKGVCFYVDCCKYVLAIRGYRQFGWPDP